MKSKQIDVLNVAISQIENTSFFREDKTKLKGRAFGTLIFDRIKLCKDSKPKLRFSILYSHKFHKVLNIQIFVRLKSIVP